MTPPNNADNPASGTKRHPKMKTMSSQTTTMRGRNHNNDKVEEMIQTRDGTTRSMKMEATGRWGRKMTQRRGKRTRRRGRDEMR
jgi:hypothetical protein